VPAKSLTSSTPSFFRFSTDALPERDRVAIWREVFGRRVTKTDLETIPGVPFFHKSALLTLPGLSLGFCAAAGFRAIRGRPFLQDGNDDLILTINTEGVTCSSQFSREVRAGRFDGAIMSCAEPSAFSVAAPARFMLIGMPRRPIAAMVNDPEAAIGQVLRNETEPLRLLTRYVSMAEDSVTFANAQLREVFTTHVYDLVALALGAVRDAEATARRRGLPAARLLAAKAFARRQLHRPDLRADIVAAHLGITPRYLHRLFESEGLSFLEYALAERLERAHRMLLAEPRRSVTAIAFAVGFGDLSYFNRTFRRRFGRTPTELRGDAGPEPPEEMG
jgi:AraC-like DNA-binding protein